MLINLTGIPPTMPTCESCKKLAIAETDHHSWCAEHYAALEDPESIEMDLYQARHFNEFPYEEAQEILLAIKKKHPELAEKYKDVYEDYDA
jgi:hypothetical protein